MPYFVMNYKGSMGWLSTGDVLEVNGERFLAAVIRYKDL